MEKNNVFMEKLAFQCSNVMGKSFNAAHPFLDSESAELRMNFVHDSIAKNFVAANNDIESEEINDKLLNTSGFDYAISAINNGE